MTDAATLNHTPLKLVTVAEFLKEQRRGTQARMARELGVSRATISQVAHDPEVFASYALAKRIKAFMECHGYTVDIETMVRTEDPADGGEAQA